MELLNHQLCFSIAKVCEVGLLTLNPYLKAQHHSVKVHRSGEVSDGEFWHHAIPVQIVITHKGIRFCLL
ncbi:hypothetical protein F385_62 [Pantoea agglomerans 299R]|nr:hypothetical protein F385_62 [Pantoea agglomerans 299R]